MLKTRYPPGPKGHFLIGNLPEFAEDLLGFFTQCAREYGDIVSLRLANWRAYLLNHPDYIEYVLVTNPRNFIKHTFFWRHVRAVFGNGLLISEGDFWLRERRLIQPAFHREQVASYGEGMVACTERLLSTWQDGEIRDIHQDMMRLTSQIVVKTLFGVDVIGGLEEVEAAFETTLEEVSIRFRRPFRIPDSIPTPGNLRYRRAVRRLDELIYAIIQQRRANKPDSGDLLSMLLHTQDEDGSQMNDQQLRDEAITLFIAGHETTALTLSWTFYLLSQYPAIEARLLEELQSVLGGRTPTAADLRQLPYTERVVMESMRLYPPAYAFGREALQDCEIGGYPVPAGTTLIMSQWVVHRD
ncbi:MAG: cytochrome P450, partial [Nitrospira sp.]|nr:cytochrome P450 [Nitrospira sp.]